MKTIDKLLEAKKTTRIKNHQIVIRPITYFTTRHNREAEGFSGSVLKCSRAGVYHNSTICLIDDSKKEFWLSKQGYNTASTKRAVDAYRKALTLAGYMNMNKIKVFQYEK